MKMLQNQDCWFKQGVMPQNHIPVIRTTGQGQNLYLLIIVLNLMQSATQSSKQGSFKGIKAMCSLTLSP